MSCIRCLALSVIWTTLLAAETIHLKTREIDPLPDRTAYQAMPLKRRTPGTSHYLVQFEREVDAGTFRQLRERGIAVTGYLPRATLMVAAPDDFSLDGMRVRWVGRLESQDKISPLVLTRATVRGLRVYVVEFHSDVDMQDARALVTEHNLHLIENLDAGAHRLLVSGPFDSLSRLASWDEVAYIFPASPELIAHVPVRACAGAVVQQTTVAQYSGPGYPWPVTNGLTLGYVFSQLTEKLPAASTQSEILRAFNEWSKAANVSFTAGTNAQATQTMNILFARGAHGDVYPFDGPGGVLAHTFYPAPPNPEPIAGDMHLDDDERWQVGANTDVYSVVLHETGHALGLMHTDNPADVMYPYYRLQTHLGAGDIAVIQAMYGTRDGSTPAQTPPPPSLPLFLTIQNPPETTTASSVTFSGTTAGGTGPARITWSTSTGLTGTASGSANWNIPAVPLNIGGNQITITATDTASDTVSQLLSVMRPQPPTPAPASPSPVSPAPQPPTNQAPPANPAPPTTPTVPNPTPPLTPQPPSSPTDTTPPWLLITYPGSSIVSTTATAITFQGLATDNVGVSSVTWKTSAGASGSAIGTLTWVAKNIPLLLGNNVVTIRAFDAAGNNSWRSITVVRR